MEKQNSTLRTINFELEKKVHSNNRHLNNININIGHHAVKTKGNQQIIEKTNSNENSTKTFSIYVIDIL